MSLKSLKTWGILLPGIAAVIGAFLGGQGIGVFFSSKGEEKPETQTQPLTPEKSLTVESNGDGDFIIGNNGKIIKVEEENKELQVAIEKLMKTIETPPERPPSKISSNFSPPKSWCLGVKDTYETNPAFYGRETTKAQLEEANCQQYGIAIN